MNPKLYRTYRSFLKQKFNKPIFKISLNGNFSCPNRDGVVGTGGCSFCENRAFSVAHRTTEPILSQLDRQANRNRHRSDRYIAYLQPYTNTYASVSELKKIYEPLIDYKGVVGLAIGTRPDCLNDEILNYLQELSKRTYLSVEIGLQSADDSVLKANNRGHSYAQFEDAILKLSKREIECVVHIMAGLPGDTREKFLKKKKKISRLPISGVKIHQLMIIEDTAVEKLYKANKLVPLTLLEYSDMVGEFIARLHPKQYIHRIMADAKIETGLIAPLWSSDKQNSINFIRKDMQQRQLFQGCKFEAI